MRILSWMEKRFRKDSKKAAAPRRCFDCGAELPVYYDTLAGTAMPRCRYWPLRGGGTVDLCQDCYAIRVAQDGDVVPVKEQTLRGRALTGVDGPSADAISYLRLSPAKIGLLKAMERQSELTRRVTALEQQVGELMQAMFGASEDVEIKA